MDAVFEQSATPRVVAVRFGKIYFFARCRYCRRDATTNVRPIDSIGRPDGDVNVCDQHADFLRSRARMKSLEIEER